MDIESTFIFWQTKTFRWIKLIWKNGIIIKRIEDKKTKFEWGSDFIDIIVR